MQARTHLLATERHAAARSMSPALNTVAAIDGAYRFASPLSPVQIDGPAKTNDRTHQWELKSRGSSR